jgi:hypothetical protein
MNRGHHSVPRARDGVKRPEVGKAQTGDVPRWGGLRACDELGPHDESRCYGETSRAERGWGRYAKDMHHQHHRHSPKPLRLRKRERHGERSLR